MNKKKSSPAHGLALSPKTHWTFVDSVTFSIVDDPLTSVTRGQGIAYDAKTKRVFFSGMLTTDLPTSTGLARDTVEYAQEHVKTPAVPAYFFENYGSNHLGSIDVFDGEILAPLEDKRPKGQEDYLYPILAAFDQDTLSYAEKYTILPRDEDQDDGLPWVAGDEASGIIYTSKYKNATKLNKFPIGSLWTGTPLREQLILSEAITRVQAGRIYEHHLYVIADEELKAISLGSGNVTPVTLSDYLPESPGPGTIYEWEHESLAFFPRDNGSLLHVTAILRVKIGFLPFIPYAVVVFDFK